MKYGSRLILPLLMFILCAPMHATNSEAANNFNGYVEIMAKDPEHDPYPNCSIPFDHFSLPLNSVERAVYSIYFPKLDLDKARITGISTRCYNCIAWTLGITNDWIWPGDKIIVTGRETTKRDFDEFYHKLGYEEADEEAASIIIWGKDNVSNNNNNLINNRSKINNEKSYITHGSVISNKSNARWESKLGASERIEHGRNEMEGNEYGTMKAYYKKISNMSNENNRNNNRNDGGININPKLKLYNLGTQYSYDTEIAKSAMSIEMNKISQAVKSEFYTKFLSWKNTWFDHYHIMDSNPHSRASGKEYEELVGMGDKIIPLLIEQMKYPANFFALYAYSHLQKNKELLRLEQPKDTVMGESQKAKMLVGSYYKYLLGNSNLRPIR